MLDCWCLCNIIIAQNKIEGIFQIDFEFQEFEKKKKKKKKGGTLGLQHKFCEFFIFFFV